MYCALPVLLAMTVIDPELPLIRPHDNSIRMPMTASHAQR